MNNIIHSCYDDVDIFCLDLYSSLILSEQSSVQTPQAEKKSLSPVVEVDQKWQSNGAPPTTGTIGVY